jgi:hypothetical protein
VAQAPSRGRSPDSQVIAISATFPLPKEQWCFLSRSARCSQWRDRAGISPASLFTRRHRRAPRNSLYGYHNGVRGSNQWRGHTRPRFRRYGRQYRSTEREASVQHRLFSLPDLGHVGNAARRFCYGPGITNFDVAVHKSVNLSGPRSLELRFEAFNVFNHAQFYGAAAVNGNITSGSFRHVVSSASPRLIQIAPKFNF